MVLLLGKGDSLEYRCFRLFQYMGYLVRRQQGVLTSGGLNQVTDLDLYGIKFHSGFSKDVITVECKSQKRLGPLDRILWVKGLKEIVGAKLSFLIIPKAKWDIKDYAFREGVRIIDFDFLDRMETALGIDKTVFYGLSDFTFYEPLYEKWKPLLSTQYRYGKTLQFLSIETKAITPNKGINKLFSEIKWVLPKLNASGNKESRISLWLLYECVVYMAIYILELCEYVQSLNEVDARGYLEKVLTYGDWNAAMADSLLKDSWTLAEKLSREQLGKCINVPQVFYKFPVPDYVKGIVEITERFCKNPKASTIVPRMLDLLFFEFLFKNKTIDKSIIRSFFTIETDLMDMSLKQAKNVIELFIKYGKVPEQYFKPISDL